MGIFDRFPYSSTHEMNLDYMLGKATEIAEDMQQVTAGMEQVQAGLSAISEKTEQATQAAAQAAQSASSIEGSVAAAEEAAEEAQMHNESAQTWANNALTYKADCQRAATEAAASSSSAAQAATAAAASEDTVAQYAQAANASAQSAANNNDSAHQYANQASASASNATFHSSNAQTAATNAQTAATNAQTAETRTAALKDDCETLHSMCVAAVDQAATEAVNAANSAAQAAATKTDVETLVESLPEDFTDLNNTVNQHSDEIDDLKSALKDSTGNIEIQFSDYTLKQYIDTSGSVIPWDSQADKPVTSTAANNEKWAIVNCNPGDKFTISGRGGNTDRFWAFADEDKNIIDPRAVEYDHATELLIVAPENARYLIINDKDNKMSYYGELVKQDISAIKNANKNVVGHERPYFNRKTFISWVSSSAMWVYGTYANNATTPAGILYPLKTGDSIELTDYSGVVFGVFTSNGQEYKRYINLTNKFTATEDCNAAITIQYSPGVALDDSNYSSLVNRVYIVHNVGIYKEINETKADINRIDTVISETKKLTIDTNFKSIAHRGYNNGYPENTEISFIKAVQEGFKFVETDIRLTSDGIPVLLHDATINRTGRNVDGTQISQTINIADITYQQALQYDFGIYAGLQFAGQKILSFDKFMGLCRNLGLQTLIEIKVASVPAACQPIIDAYDMNDNVTYLGLTSFIDYVYNQNPYAKYAVLVDTISAAVIATIKEKRNLGKNVIMDANYEHITPELFEAVKSEHIPLIVFTINDDNTILNLDPYISGVSSNYKNAGIIIYNHYMSLLP